MTEKLAADSGAERAARRIAEQMNDRGRTYDNSPTIEEIAAIIREETGTPLEPKSLWGWSIQEIKSAMRQFQTKHPGKSPLEIEGDEIRAWRAAAPDEGGTR